MTSVSADEDWTEEEPSRPFEPWLDDYMNSTATVDALGALGSRCRDAADRLVSELLADPNDPAARSRFTRTLGFLIFDSYRLDGWEEYEK
ncbi:hypothetical protein [Actinoplanes couchii]|uniref:Uncharacterized protein n=1 Tax=Actinoplanes couchii TaxID=403638 RepID=A0ABQ3XTB8_9ACTN|nr:hypothetical protein [Actinoplanes couchii]MDR6319054.1 hypothetical protein [Actinoplanes couchii]GID61761.1 hypothetical protein Aco03nite_101650 [Actinoplanes couchii]